MPQSTVDTQAQETGEGRRKGHFSMLNCRCTNLGVARHPKDPRVRAMVRVRVRVRTRMVIGAKSFISHLEMLGSLR